MFSPAFPTNPSRAACRGTRIADAEVSCILFSRRCHHIYLGQATGQIMTIAQGNYCNIFLHARCTRCEQKVVKWEACNRMVAEIEAAPLGLWAMPSGHFNEMALTARRPTAAMVRVSCPAPHCTAKQHSCVQATWR
jgi:hypothetical protein